MTAFRVGVLLPVSRMLPRLDRDFLSGLRAGLGTESVATELAIEAAGAAADPDVVKEKMQRLLLQHQPHIVTGVLGSAMLRHVQAQFNDAHVPLIVNNLGVEPLLNGGVRNPYVFHNSFNLWQSTYALGCWAAQTLGTRAGVMVGFHESGYGIVSAFCQGFCDAGGGTIEHIEVTHRESSDEDPSASLHRLLASKPDFVAALYAGRSALSFMNAYAQCDAARALPLVGSAFLPHRQWLREMGDEIVGFRTAFSWNQEDNRREHADFRAACAAHECNDPDVFALLGYETGLAIAATAAAGQTGGAHEGKPIEAILPHVDIRSPRGLHRFDADTGEMPTRDYLLEMRRPDELNTRAVTIGPLDVPERYAADHAAYRAQEIRSGWTNAYMVT